MNIGKRIAKVRKEKGISQTELGEICGTTKQTIFKYENGIITNIPLDKLEKIADALDVPPAYLMGWEGNYDLPTNIHSMPHTRRVPRLGRIAYGEPILADGNIEGYDEVPEYIHCDFTLICKGESMINARIFNGDIVCIRQQDEVENGEIAAIRVDNEEATLKRFRKFEDRIVLEPENPTCTPFVFWGEEMARVHVLGKATHFISLVR